MMAGAESIKIHGKYVPVRAEVKNLDMCPPMQTRTKFCDGCVVSNSRHA